MADVFISYSHADRAKAAALADALAARGVDVWWDTELAAGERFAASLAKEIDGARLTVVLWSASSVTSDYVCDEADRARQMNALAPVLLDAIRPPVGFGQLHTHDLTDWSGAADAPELADFAERIAARLAGADAPRPASGLSIHGGRSSEARPAPPPPKRSLRSVALLIALIAVIGAGAAVWTLIGGAGGGDEIARCDALAGEDAVSFDALRAAPDDARAACAAALATGEAPPRITYQLGRVQDAARDWDGAEAHYLRAAEAGHAPALAALCASYAHDDKPEARDWCERAAAAGSKSAEDTLSTLN